MKEGIRSISEIKRCLKRALKESFGADKLPDRSNRRFYPSNRIIRSRVCRAQNALKRSLIDQESLILKIGGWKKEDPGIRIFFRPKGSQSISTAGDEEDVMVAGSCDDQEGDLSDDVRCFEHNPDSLLFVYQSAWQRNLLHRYGTELILLDATYRTTRYALPLFFLVVKTNIDYQIVGTFVCESESVLAITEALKVIAEWNPGFKPSHCMTDYCLEEINAVEEVFPGR